MYVSRLKNSYGLGAVIKIIRPTSTNAVPIKINQGTTSAPKPWKEIPGPSRLPVVGPILHMLPGGSLYNKAGMELLDQLYKDFGPIVKLDGLLGRPNFIFLFDPEASAQVLRSENLMPIRPGFDSLEYYRKKHNQSQKFEDTTGLLTEQGENWKSFRSTVNPAMLQPKTVKLYGTVLDEVAQDMITRMRSLRDNNNMIKNNLDIEMNKWALESIGVVALGGRIGCLSEDIPEDSPARQLIQCVHDIFKTGDELDFKPSLWKFYPTQKFKQAMKLYERHVNLSKHFIKLAVKNIEKKNASKNPNEEKGVMEKLLEIDEHVAIIMAADMLFAGVDTAANTMLATFYLLAVNPGKQDKLREEVLSGEGKRSYLKACIKESLRLLPVAGANLRQTSREYNLCDYKIPKGTNVVFSHQYMAQMEDQYPNSKMFIPERWVVPKDDPLYHGNAHPFAMMPFGFGVRQCIGKRIADLEMETFLHRFIQNFKVEWAGDEPLNVKTTSLNYVVEPFNYVFKDLRNA